MAPALNNAQGELSPLEIGLHVLGSRLTNREYAKKLGVPETAPAHRIQAARVVTHISGNALETTAAAFDGPPEKQVEALEFNSKGLSHTTHPAG
jgi:hypothetical protein